MRKILFFILSFPLLLNSQTKELWGVTSSGGVSSDGVIFKTDANGENIQVIHNFTVEFEGKNPGYSTLVEGSDNKLYGLTKEGGLYNKGILFEFDSSTNIYTKKIDFGTLEKGESPWGSLTKATDGRLYGMTNLGGTNNKGILFVYDPIQNSISKLFDFDGENGAIPYGSLLVGSNNNLYGLTNSGGINDSGILFEFDMTENSFSKKIDFDGGNGRNPFGDLVQLTNGKLYGMTYGGGTYDHGVIFEYDINDNKLENKFNFQRTNTGANPFGSLLKSTNGKLYGMTSSGGSTSVGGTIFEFDPNTNTFTIKQRLSNYALGTYPRGNLIELENGILLGLTSAGGANGNGTLFEYKITSETFTKKIDFSKLNTGNTPYGTLFKANNGKLYGITSSGGHNNNGILFEYHYSGNILSKKIDFNKATKGNYPYALTQIPNGKIYGVTRYGGDYGHGTLFEIDPKNNIFTKKIDFDGTNGSFPYGKLLINTLNNKLYGTTVYGGQNNNGTLFEYDIFDNLLVKKIDFKGSNGSLPYGNLILHPDNKLYGITWIGGKNSLGTFYEFDLSNNNFNVKFDFEQNLGIMPSGINLSSNGKFYGMTYQGGINNDGVIFEYNSSENTFNKKFDFDKNNGSQSNSPFIEISNGKLFGSTTMGGKNNFGVLFEYDPLENVYTKKFDFDKQNGNSPFGNVIFTSDNLIFGLATFGGNYNSGVMFKYDLNNSTYAKKVDFNGILGAVPFDIIEVTTENLSITDQTFKNTSFIYPNPTAGTIFIKNTDALSFELFSLDGRMINSGQVDKNYRVDLVNISSGNYIIKLKTKDGEEISQKIIKK
ncbi:hypothetical protein D3C87_961700 [compost metagenome]